MNIIFLRRMNNHIIHKLLLLFMIVCLLYSGRELPASANGLNVQATPCGYALVFLNPDAAYGFGHVAWGVSTTNQAFWGSVEGTRAGWLLPPVGPVSTLDIPPRNATSLQDAYSIIITDMKQRAGYRDFAYQALYGNSCNLSAAQQAWTKIKQKIINIIPAPYILLLADCLDATISVTTAFGAYNLPGDTFIDAAPVEWFSDLTTENDWHWMALADFNNTLEPAPAPLSIPSPTPKQDAATFLTDVTLPDYPNTGGIVAPGTSPIKTWRIKNTGRSTWGPGYKLAYSSGDRLGAPQSIDLPTIAPGQTADLSLQLQIPPDVAPGTKTGYWQLQNPQGTHFGDVIWFKLNIPGPQPATGNGVIIQPGGIVVNSPSNVAPGQQFLPAVTVSVGSGQLRQDRGDMLRFSGGTNFTGFDHIGVVGTVDSGQNYTFQFYKEHPFVAPSTPGTYESHWRVWANGGWVGDEAIIRFTVASSASSQRPDPPTPTSPANWAVLVGQQPTLCANTNGPSGVTITGYYFEIYESAQLWNSGWTGSSCVTTSGLGNYGYTWHVKVQTSAGQISDWSSASHFTLQSSTVTITDFHFDPPSPSNVSPVVIWVNTDGCGQVNVSGQVFVNTAADGTANGEWRKIKDIGPKTNAEDAPRWDTLDYAEGTHLVRVQMKSCDNTITTQDKPYTLTRGQPSRPFLLGPANGFWSNNPTITFRWQPAMRATNYRLVVGTTQALTQSLVLDRMLTDTQYTYTFTQDYQQLYWRVYANNEIGSTIQDGWWFGIDRVAPTAAITASQLPTVTYESQIPVVWGGHDAASGIQNYDIQVSSDGSEQWTDWLVGYPYTTAIFNTQSGHTYCFRARAHDIAGNGGTYPAQPDRCVQVDSTKRPPQTWWNTAYQFKRALVIANRMDTVALPAGYAVQLHFDGSTTPTAAEIYNASLTSPKGNDIRIVYNDQTELTRHVVNFSPSGIDLWFAVQADIPASSSSSAYTLYYSNPNAGIPPSNLTDVYLPHEDGGNLGIYYLEEDSGSSPPSAGSFGAIAWQNSPPRSLEYGRFGKGVHLDGNQWGEVTGVPNGSLGTQLTAEAWVWFDGAAGQTYTKWSGVLTRWSPDHAWWRISATAHGLLHANLDIRTADGNHVERGIEYQIQTQTNRWYHLALTYDGNVMRFWVDGEVVGSINQAGSVWDEGTKLFVGRNNYNAATDPPLQGRIDGIRISNVARSSFPYAKITTLPVAAAGQQLGQETIGPAHLVVQNLQVMPNPTGGLLVQAVIQNQGAYPTYNEFYIDLYKDYVPTGPNDRSHSLGFWVNAPIQPGATLTLTQVITQNTVALSSTGKTPAASTPASEQIFNLATQADSTGMVNQTTRAGTILSGTQACLAIPDAYQNATSAAQAVPIAIGETQTHNVYQAGSQAWVKFQAEAGKKYLLTTSQLGGAADTVLSLYDSDGTTQLASNDDYGGSLASQIAWTAPRNGTYYVLVQHWNPNVAGCGTSYELTITWDFGNKAYLPLGLRSANGGW